MKFKLFSLLAAALALAALLVFRLPESQAAAQTDTAHLTSAVALETAMPQSCSNLVLPNPAVEPDRGIAVRQRQEDCAFAELERQRQEAWDEDPTVNVVWE